MVLRGMIPNIRSYIDLKTENFMPWVKELTLEWHKHLYFTLNRFYGKYGINLGCENS